MHKPRDPGSNVHNLNQPHPVKRQDDVLGTLYEALAHSKAEDNAKPSTVALPNEQRIDGDGNLQLVGETVARQSITGNNNIQIGAVQLVVKVVVNVER